MVNVIQMTAEWTATANVIPGDDLGQRGEKLRVS